MTTVPELPDLSQRTLAAYQRLLDGEQVQPDTPGLQDLIAGGMAVNHPANATYAPVEPRYGIFHLLTVLNEHMQALAGFTNLMPEFLGETRDRFRAARPTADAPMEHLVGRDAVNLRIAEEHQGAAKEILASQPGPRTAEDLEHSFGRDVSALRRGLHMRTLYHHSVRRVTNVGDWARRMADAGGEVRTLNGRFPRSIIFDRRVAFVPVHLCDGDPPTDEAVLIKDPLVVAQIAAVYELFWERGEPWYGGRAAYGADLQTTAIQRAILRELCLGRNQKAAAKNLGISSAWLNDQLRDLKTKLGVDTLNEVIYWWATSPDHDMQD